MYANTFAPSSCISALHSIVLECQVQHDVVRLVSDVSEGFSPHLRASNELISRTPCS